MIIGERNRCKDCGPSMARVFGIIPSVIVSISMVVAHTLFALGQFKNLYHYDVSYALNQVTADVDVKFGGHHTFNISLPNVKNNITLLGESYNSTLHDLWTYNTENAWLNGDPNFSYNMSAPYILFFCLLIMSGLWPHCKLLAVHLLWYLPANPKIRKRSLWWLDFFGKYSMTDVFAMLTMVSWAQIHAVTTTKEAVYSTLDNLPGFLINQTNTTILAEDLCHKAENWTHFCEDVIEFIVEHPNTLLNHLEFSRLGGDMALGLNVVTDSGLYFFSTAVWATLLISAGVNLAADSLDSRQRSKPVYYALEDPTSPMNSRPLYSTLVTGFPLWRKFAILSLLVCWFLALVGGLIFPMVTRALYGTIMQLAQIPNLLTDEQIHDKYNLITTIRDVGLGGGGNAFLQKDLAAFTIIFPFLMVIVAFSVLFVPLKPKVQSFLAEAVKFCFSFSGWEILIIVTLVMTSELQALTVTIPAGVTGGVTMCRSLAAMIINAPRGGVCFEEDLNLEASGFCCLIAGAIGMIAFRLLIPILHDRRHKRL